MADSERAPGVPGGAGAPSGNPRFPAQQRPHSVDHSSIGHLDRDPLRETAPGHPVHERIAGQEAYVNATAVGPVQFGQSWEFVTVVG